MTVQVKICGLTRPDDVLIACQAGANFCGVVVEVPASPRSLSHQQARSLFALMTVPPVLVTRGKSLDELIDLTHALQPAVLQLHGDEPPELVATLKRQIACALWKALPIPVDADTNLLPSLLSQARAFLRAGADALLLDAATPKGFGGQGVCPSWELTAELVRRLDAPCWLAGGLTPENVADAIKTVRPFGVDVSSGVEVSPGVKDPEKVWQFCQRAKGKTP
jgi:phosphoribosylanthranilate isomerase